MRKLLARLRHMLAAKGVDLRPQSDGSSGAYSGFSLSWKPDGAGTMRGAISRVTHSRGEARFFIENERDFIQRCHLSGAFYEENELEIIAANSKGGKTFLDIGANVGNHSVFAGLFLGFERLIMVEPNPSTAAILDVNLRLNGLMQKGEIKRVALSDEAGRAPIVLPLDNNLGAARIGSGGDNGVVVDLVRGDDLFSNETIGFVKIDIEGHELKALRGMQTILEKDRPTVFVEVEKHNEAEVVAFMAGLGYQQREDLHFANDRSNQLYVHSST